MKNFGIDEIKSVTFEAKDFPKETYYTITGEGKPVSWDKGSLVINTNDSKTCTEINDTIIRGGMQIRGGKVLNEQEIETKIRDISEKVSREVYSRFKKMEIEAKKGVEKKQKIEMKNDWFENLKNETKNWFEKLNQSGEVLNLENRRKYTWI